MTRTKLSTEEKEVLSKVNARLRRGEYNVGAVISSETLFTLFYKESDENTNEETPWLINWLIRNGKLRFFRCCKNGQSDFVIISLKF